MISGEIFTTWLATLCSLAAVHLEPLEAGFRSNRNLVVAALGYAQYPYSQEVQAEAVKLAQHFTARIPNLLECLNLPGKGEACSLPSNFALGSSTEIGSNGTD